jgi:hypothetical protein
MFGVPALARLFAGEEASLSWNSELRTISYIDNRNGYKKLDNPPVRHVKCLEI